MCADLKKEFHPTEYFVQIFVLRTSLSTVGVNLLAANFNFNNDDQA